MGGGTIVVLIFFNRLFVWQESDLNFVVVVVVWRSYWPLSTYLCMGLDWGKHLLYGSTKEQGFLC